MASDASEAFRESLKTAKSVFYLGAQKVGQGQAPYFIAEIGNNHNGDFFLAKRSIEAAAKAGAHAVKFQKRSIPDTFASELREKPQTKGDIKGKTYGEYREGLELSFEEFVELKKIAEFHNVAFFATPFDIPSVEFLERVGVPFYKIASFDVTNLPLIERVAKTGKPVILSTGMSALEEVDEAVAAVLAHHAELAILHCVSVYPSPDEHIQLGLMKQFQRRYHPLPVGYSGHETDILPTLVAIALGASVIERHFTLSRNLPGPDHGTVSLEPEAFGNMVASAARIQTMLGDAPKKTVSSDERTTRDKHSKSIVSAVAIPKGTRITRDMLTCKSPGYGMRPRDLRLVVGKETIADIPADSVIRKEDIAWEGAVVATLSVASRKRK